jgi:hypothetical protein
MELDQLVQDFAAGMASADARRPQAFSRRDPSRVYQHGIGPFAEDDAVALTVGEMQAMNPEYVGLAKRRYPAGAKTCDLALGELPEWAIEVKLARVGRDNGTYEDTAVKKILSPYADDRSAVTDCKKLSESGFEGRKAILIYGFEDPKRPLAWLIKAFELIAGQHVNLGERQAAQLLGLVHPIFAAGEVFAWEVFDPT